MDYFFDLFILERFIYDLTVNIEGRYRLAIEAIAESKLLTRHKL